MQPLGKHSWRLKDLRRRIRRRVDGEVIVDGTKLVDDLLRWCVPVREIYVSSRWAAHQEWFDAARETYLVDDEILANVAPTRSPQGVVAVVGEPRWPEWSPRGVNLYLDGIQDPGNVGAIIRSAAGLGAEAVLLGPGCADPFGAAAIRGSAGSVFRIQVVRDVQAETAAGTVERSGGEVWAAGMNGEAFATWKPTKPLMLLLGAEGQGLSEEVQKVACNAVTIGLHNQIESLNVAVAASLLLARALEITS